MFVSPNSCHMKKISSDKLEEIWNEMKYIEAHNEACNADIAKMLADNKLLFAIGNEQCEIYKNYARNIQSLADLHSDPFAKYSEIVGTSVLVIGAGTVGAALLKLLNKYGVKNIHLVEGDVIAMNNLTSQLLYEKDDVNLCKSTVAKSKITDLKLVYNEYLTEKNITKILSETKSNYVFCCADDSSLKLHNLLLNYLESYKYNLLVAGYSYSNLFVDFITAKDVPAFKQLYNISQLPDKEKIIFHNTGTLVDGYLSAAFIMQIFIDSFTEMKYNHFSFNKEQFATDKNYLRLLNEEDEFNRCYDNYIAYQKNTAQVKDSRAWELFDSNLTKSECGLGFMKKMISLNEAIIKYNQVKGDFTQQYKLAMAKQSDIEQVRTDICRDVHDKFANQYLELINLRKNTVTKDIKSRLIHDYGYDFMQDIVEILRNNTQRINVDPSDMLQLSVETLDERRITFAEAIMCLLESDNSHDFKLLIITMLKNNLVDYELRPNKSVRTMTIYNPVKKFSNIIMNYTENVSSLRKLNHEFVHAYVFNLFKDKLNLHNFKRIDTNFWEILAKTGELIISKTKEQTAHFISLSSYNLAFCLLDYFIANEAKDLANFSNIMYIKEKINILFGLNVKSTYYTDYNFILYPLLYNNDLSLYNLVYQDAIALAIYEYILENGLTFASFFEELKGLEQMTVNAILCKCKLTYQDIMTNYVERSIKVLHQSLLIKK